MPIDLSADFLQRRPANFRPMTPLQFLRRAADVFPDRTAVIHGEMTFTWREHDRRCRMLASALKGAGAGEGDVVAILCPNTPAMLEAHFGVPMAGAILNTLNTRLDAAAIAFILEHSETKVLIVDRQWSDVASAALAKLKSRPLVVHIDDPYAEGGELIGDLDYETFIGRGDPDGEGTWPNDEFDAITLNYTSGTTGNPKGALYHHRGCYLNTLSQIVHHELNSNSVYLWTLPMFHVNGWCFSWGMAAIGGTHVCLRRVLPAEIFASIDKHGVTHMCGAPTVLGMLIEGAAKTGIKLQTPVAIMTAGAAPPAPILKATEELGFTVRHVYGMTEMHGVAALCDWHREWNSLSAEERSKRMARQGVRNVVTDDMIVGNPVTLAPVPHDGATIGEILFRGNNGMKGYLKNPTATDEAFAGGWYRTGDLAVTHPDGYIEIKDRSKDIIISGGENISSIEIEEVIFQHPSVSYAAVVAMKDERWGETPCVFVELKEGHDGLVSADEMLDFCRARLAKFKLPRKFVFGPIERTSTGKVQKFKLRDRAHSA
ncbi:AMP-binding protein [Bradyrhizobium sp. SBR1B]|uniref:AMP-binding protein n=1 Tax=Bradyrhizobium sp. SBR1B TaxID=2663836 RepID=UPI0016063DDD|nr:AMP-binding protein [Bradyrhizobium sp. SBR1B]MBB4381951.1 fatty-acyl-CoA synthase [Bradyrhizobium sp. SBR1B]